MNSEDQGTVNKSSITDGSTNSGKVNLTQEKVQLPLQDNTSSNAEKSNINPPARETK